MRDVTAESADMVLVYENSQKKQAWLQAELDNRERELVKKLVSERFRKWKKLNRICCAEAERTQELRTDAFTRHELQEGQSTVNQLTIQIQESQDRVNSLTPTFPVIRYLFPVHLESFAAILARPQSSFNWSELFGNALPRLFPAA